MKHLKSLVCISLSLLLALSLCACASSDGTKNEDGLHPEIGGQEPSHNDFYSGQLSPDQSVVPEDGTDVSIGAVTQRENPFVSTATSPISTFSADVDTASYTLFRKLSASNYTEAELRNYARTVPFRTEEMVNYFDYSYPAPAEGAAFGQTASIAPAPWSNETYLMVLGLTTEPIRQKGANNLVFLIDVSGSMASSDKLPLLKNAFSALVSALDEQDTVSIVTYSGRESVVLEGCAGDRDEEIMNAINSLSASGSTNGQSGLQKAYELAGRYRKTDGNNRIIMASDGDLNVGISTPEALKAYISEKRDQGIFLSVMGFGTGNYRDDTMSALAQNGNGVYYYIDSAREAEKVLGTDLLSTLYTVAKDVKLQLTFRPEAVAEYRLIGYENRLLANEDFNDDTKDAGEVGAGHAVTVCYELKLTESAKSDGGRDTDWMTLAIRYKQPSGTDSILEQHTVTGAALTDAPTDDHRFVASVISLSMLLNESSYNQRELSVGAILETLSALDLGQDADKTEFRSLVGRLLPTTPY